MGIVYHWMGGKLSGTDAWFQNPKSKSSAHYGIGAKGEIHQYVKDNYYAFANNDTEANQKYISIEHEGGYPTGSGLAVPTQQCLDASVELSKYLAEKHGFSLIRQETAWKHNEVSNKYTTCPGSLDIDYIISQVNKPMYTFEDFLKWNNDIKTKGLVSDVVEVKTKPENIPLVQFTDNLTEDQKQYLVNLYEFNETKIPKSVQNTEWLDKINARYGAVYFPRSSGR